MGGIWDRLKVIEVENISKSCKFYPFEIRSKDQLSQNLLSKDLNPNADNDLLINRPYSSEIKPKNKIHRHDSLISLSVFRMFEGKKEKRKKRITTGRQSIRNIRTT